MSVEAEKTGPNDAGPAQDQGMIICVADLNPFAEASRRRREENRELRDETPLRFAFVGRCSTEDYQDPATSKTWQLQKAQSLVSSVGGKIVREYFDIGESRSVPWASRPESGRFLEDAARVERLFDALVVGEGQRCFYDRQFGDIQAVLMKLGMEVWVPELGGAYDPENPTHHTIMAVMGPIS